MSKFSQNRTTQFDEVEEPKFKKKVKEKRKSSDNAFLEDFQKPNDHWANSTKGNFMLFFLLFHYFLLLLILLLFFSGGELW